MNWRNAQKIRFSTEYLPKIIRFGKKRRNFKGKFCLKRGPPQLFHAFYPFFLKYVKKSALKLALKVKITSVSFIIIRKIAINRRFLARFSSKSPIKHLN